MVNVFNFSSNPLLPYHQNDMNYFDFLLDIEDISDPPGKTGSNRFQIVHQRHQSIVEAVCEKQDSNNVEKSTDY